MSTIVFFAVKEEARFFHPPEGCIVLLTGMGDRSARAAAENALRRQRPARALTCGFAGGLNPALGPGALVFETDDARAATILAELGAIPAAFHCHHRVATTRAEKAALRQQSGADAVEMESGVIRQICREHHVPATTLRVISDTAGEDLPLDFNDLMSPQGGIRLGGLIGQVLFRPSRWRGLRQLQLKTIDGARRLAECLEALLRRLD